MNATDAGTGALVPVPPPSLELGTTAARNGTAAGRLLGEIDLAATPAAVRLARSYVRELVGQCFGAGREELADLELLTSEAMTESVLRSRPRPGGTVTLAVLHLDRYLRVEITDGGLPPGPPRPPDDQLPGGGRGRLLMQALAADQGTHRNRNGTSTSWFGVPVGERWRRP
ncbi:ATP-binding protein [Actinomadura opuntiae]|uniref:ATP-binding protein n=1 Tax=Actinomadura sp. OS1-43 TaxID=604315 RepID=UPI00255A7FF2|nr:ATP-binding protein [Actinomadura sp. OS1-43]MDL4817773.1 ATP-binding protein [Actinomadura sp. OS1-43]